MSLALRPGARPWPSPALARAIPFAAFIVLMAVEPWLGRVFAEMLDPRWWYAIRSAVAAGLLVLLWPRFGELSGTPPLGKKAILFALGSGAVVLAIWLLLDDGLFVLGQAGAGFDPRSADGRVDWPLALARLLGSALLVPLLEELFWRSLVMRWIVHGDFRAVDPAGVGGRALLLSSLAFGFEHGQWAAGILAGLAYGWLYMRSRNLWLAVIAHAVTNAGLGVWVLATGAWHFW